MIFLNRMHNREVNDTLKDCRMELQDIKTILSTDTAIKFNRITKYLTNYSIVKACSTIEYSYKKIIADFFESGQSIYVKKFISEKVRRDSSNPSLTIINQTLKSFDVHYNDEFNRVIKQSKKRYNDSLEKLREARNTVAHGGNITTNVDFVILHFQVCREMLTALDGVLEERNKIRNNLEAIF